MDEKAVAARRQGLLGRHRQNRRHRDDGRHADHDAEQREDRAKHVGTQRAQCRLGGFGGIGQMREWFVRGLALSGVKPEDVPVELSI